MDYLEKPCNSFSNQFTGHYLKPATCPYCGKGTDAIDAHKTWVKISSDKVMLVSTCTCTACDHAFYFNCLDVVTSDDNAEMVYIYPASEESYKNDLLEKISPRFIDLYNQALHSELRGDLDLAAMGYRSCLEVLIKDFAINELGEDENDVARTSLFDAISKYLKDDSLVKTSDVVRILGNDYTHYRRKHPEHDFDILKSYLDIFLRLVEVRYKINHPPVGRLPE